MAVIDIKVNPTRTDLRVFAVLWLIFFGLLARIVFWKPEALLIASAVTGTAFLISIALNTDFPKRMQFLGVSIPLVLLTIGGLEYLGVKPRSIAWVLIGIGVIGAFAVLSSHSLGKSLYTKWMYAALPLGWTFSHLVLGVVFFLVITPIGCILRLTGKDPMERAFDRSAASYWKPHEQTKDLGRYFRQF